MLADSGTFLFSKMPAETVLIEILADFLFRFKDRYPYSNSEIKDYIDVFYMIMEFLIPNSYLPSAALLKEYSKSKLTRELSTLPSLEYFNSKFGENCKMSEEDYELLRKRFESRLPFVYYFNPSIQLQEKFYCNYYMIGFFDKDDVSVNK